MTDVMDDARRIKRGILDFIHTYGCEQAPEEAFGALARDVFIYQYTYDLPYRRYCAAKRVTPATLKDWREIPPMPVDGFKHLDLSTIPTEQCEAVFMTLNNNFEMSERCNISPRFSMKFFGRCNISRTFGFYNDLINKSEEALQWN